MSLHRLVRVAGLDLGQHLRRPMLWMLVLLVGFLSWGLSTGDARISSGDTSVGGQEAWITSQFANAYVLSVSVFSFYGLFVAVLAGMAVIRDDELKVGEVLHATPLTAGEYVWGKALAVLAAFGGVLAVHLVLMAVFNHLVPNSAAEEIRGPFLLSSYLVPAAAFGLPTLVFVTGTCFAVGERTRRPILVFVLPLAVLLGCFFFFWTWSPSWLDPRLDRLLMLLDPAGFRWLEHTWLRVDRGVQFYNTGRIGFDLPFLASRLAYVLVGVAAVAFSHLRLGRTMRGGGSREARRRRAPAEPEVGGGETLTASLSALGMSRRRPGFIAAAREVARVDLKELASSPGLYLFVPIILLQAFGSVVSTGALEAPLLLTPGLAAARMMNTITLLVCLLLAFYTVESLWRDQVTGLGAIAGSSPVRSGALLLGKTLANSVVGAVILLVALLVSLVIILVQGEVALSLVPFAVLWGGLLLPTFLLWTSFVAAAFAVTRSRYATYGLAIAAFLATGYVQFKGEMTWVGNWNLWDAVRWSDMGPLELDRPALLLNRLLALALAVLLTAVAVRFYPRTERDAALILSRLQPAPLARGLGRALPVLLPPLVLGTWLWVLVDRGPEGGAAEKAGRDYWKQNLATYKDAPLPAISEVELDLDLEPDESRFAVTGSYLLVNREEQPVARFPVTTGHHLRDVAWTLNGRPYDPEERSGLWVVTPPAPLATGDSAELGFSYRGRLPDGITANGGRMPEFILPCGTVLTSFSPSLAPVLGFVEEIGVDDENRYEPRVYPDDFWVGRTSPLYGTSAGFSTRITVTLPAAYHANSVGVLVRDEVNDGRRTVEWRSDERVRFFNVVAGRWEVRRGTGTAVYFHPEHHQNVDEMLAALDGARRFYSEWFHPYPWKELKLSEFADLARYAQGFPTNITFSEGIGFLTEDDPRANTAFAIAAHESAHQWWGNILTPGKGPGGNIVAEGLSHFSAALLLEQVRGPLRSMEFRKRIEESYGNSRRADAERPMLEVDGSKEGDTTVTYDKGGWVFWMLADMMGRDAALAGLREFVERYKDGPDFPVLQDLLAVMREHATDAVAFDAFVEQWFERVAVPEYRVTAARARSAGGAGDPHWEVEVSVRNEGTAVMPVEVAAARGERLGDNGEPNPDYRDARVTVTLAPGEGKDLVIRCDFEPDRVLPDPDVRVLQLNRAKGLRRL